MCVRCRLPDTGGVESTLNKEFPWRPIVLGPVAAVLFALALYFYNNQQVEIGLILLGLAFSIAMTWIVLACRDAESAESPVRQFVPRLTAVLVLGSAFIAFVMRARDPRIPFIEAGFIIFYTAAGGLAMRIFNAKPKRPPLTAISGGNHRPRQKSRSQAR